MACTLEFRTLVLAAFVAAWGVAGEASAASQLCEGGTHLLMPGDGGTVDPASALVFADRACTVPEGADPDDPVVMIAVEDLTVDVEGEPAALVPFADFDSGWLWRIEPPPPAGSTVSVTGCDLAEREEGLCYGFATELAGEEPMLQWSFTVDGEPDRVPLVEPQILGVRSSGSADPFSGEERTVWSFTVERGQDDPGTPMLVDITMNPGPSGVQLPWLDPDDGANFVTLGAPKGADICIEARTVDLYGNEGPTALACRDGGGEGCGCTSGGRGPGALALGLLVLGLRRRRTLRPVRSRRTVER